MSDFESLKTSLQYSLKQIEAAKKSNFDLQVSIGDSLKKKRESLGMSIREMASKLGMSSTYLTHLESGVRSWSIKKIDDYQDAIEDFKS